MDITEASKKDLADKANLENTKVDEVRKVDGHEGG